MPCWEIQTYSLVFKAENRDLLEKALGNSNEYFQKIGEDTYVLNRGIKIYLDKGEARVDEGQQSRLNEIKRQYSMETLKDVAKKKRWQMIKDRQNQFAGKIRRF